MSNQKPFVDALPAAWTWLMVAKLGGLKLDPIRLRTIPHVRLIGCGTALNACKIGQLAIESLARIPAVAHVQANSGTTIR